MRRVLFQGNFMCNKEVFSPTPTTLRRYVETKSQTVYMWLLRVAQAAFPFDGDDESQTDFIKFMTKYCKIPGEFYSE